MTGCSRCGLPSRMHVRPVNLTRSPGSRYVGQGVGVGVKTVSASTEYTSHRASVLAR